MEDTMEEVRTKMLGELKRMAERATLEQLSVLLQICRGLIG